MALDPITAIANVANTVLSRVLPDAAAQAAAKQAMAQMYLTGELQEMTTSAGVISAEAASANRLTSSWRPMLMYVFMAIIINNYILAPYLQAMFHVGLTLQLPPDMWDLLKLGVGGYVVGRSVEKAATTLTGTPIASKISSAISNTFQGH